MAGQGNAKSMADGLNKMLGQLAQMMIYPDADISILQQLQQAITQYLRQSSTGQGPMGGAGGPGMPGGMPGAPGGPAQGMPTPPGADLAAGGTGAMGGAMPGPGMPNPDELRRMLQTVPGGQGG